MPGVVDDLELGVGEERHILALRGWPGDRVAAAREQQHLVRKALGGGRHHIGDGTAVFTPSPAATFAVAIAIMGAALVVALTGGIISLPLPGWTYVTAAVLIALLFAARAIGDFGLVGFFKTRGDGAFARLDTWVYSPLCLVLALAIATIIATRGRAG